MTIGPDVWPKLISNRLERRGGACASHGAVINRIAEGSIHSRCRGIQVRGKQQEIISMAGLGICGKLVLERKSQSPEINGPCCRTHLHEEGRRKRIACAFRGRRR